VTSLASLRLPEPEQVQELLTMMLGREVAVRDLGPNPPVDAIPVAVATFADGDALTGCVWIDLELGAGVGAAIAMADRSEADACHRSGVLAPEYVANVREMLLLAGGLLGQDREPPRLRDLELLENGLAEDTLGLLADPRQGGFYFVELGDYGNGRMGFALV
jgi:hypothetical protein